MLRKRAQEVKSTLPSVPLKIWGKIFHTALLKKKAQEEMVGFILIIVLVAIILLVFLGFSLNQSPAEVESYEVNNFIWSFLSYTTDCQDSNNQYYSVQDLIFQCEKNPIGTCLDENNTCEVLNETLKGILNESWDVGENWPNKGYELKIFKNSTSGMEPIIPIIGKGNKTNNYKGSSQLFSKSRGREMFYINFRVYY